MGSAESSLFDVSPDVFPWRAELYHSILECRARLGGHLFIDRLLQIAGLDPLSLYPPNSRESFEILMRAIDGCYFDRLKKNCLFYYMLKFWNNGAEEVYAQKNLIPPQFAILSDAYWYLDQGYVEPAVYKLCDPRVTPDFVPHILRAIVQLEDPQHASRLILRFVRMGRPVLIGADELGIYMDALCGSSMMEAWTYQRTFPEDEKPDSMRTQLLRRIMDYCLLPSIKPDSLKALVAFPFTSYEDKQVTAYALKPPHPLSAPALSILQELIIVRLIHQGRYSEAIRLDRQFSLDVSGAARAAGGDGSSILAKAAESRRQTIHEIMGVLPQVQRKLLEVEFGSDSFTRAAPPSSTNDLSMSWEDLNESTPTRNPGVRVPLAAADTSMSFMTDVDSINGDPAPSPPSKARLTQPITGTTAFRQSNPQVALLQAFAQSSRMEGSPSPSVRASVLGASGSSISSPLKSSVGLSVPFGSSLGSNPSIVASASVSARSGIGASASLTKMMNRPAFNIRPRSSLGNSSIISSVQPSPQPSATLNSSLSPYLQQQATPTQAATTKPHDPSANPFYRPSEDDAHRPFGATSNSKMSLKRSFGQVAQFPSPSRDIDMDGNEPDSDDDVVLNQSIYNHKSVGSLAAVGSSQQPHLQANGTTAVAPFNNLALNQQVLSETAQAADEAEEVDFPGAFPSSTPYAESEPEMDTDAQDASSPPASRRGRGKLAQQEATPSSKRHARTSAANTRPSASSSTLKKPTRTVRSSRSKDKSRPDESERDGEDEGDGYGRGALRRATRGSSRLSVVSSTGSPERKKQRSVEPEDEPTNTAALRKSTRSTARKSASNLSNVPSSSSLVSQPSRMVTRRQQAVIEE